VGIDQGGLLDQERLRGRLLRDQVVVERVDRGTDHHRLLR
jgi:hypothetical protein